MSTLRFLLFLGLTGAAIAAPRITGGATNAASRITVGLPDYGVARGALFALRGRELGPAEAVRAEFPLPSTDGLGGVTVQATIGGTTVDALLVSVSDGQVLGILPSTTPLGSGTVRLTYNGASAQANIQVVEAAFGIFNQPGLSYGPAIAWNVNGGTAELNGVTKPARPGQQVTVLGTGLGAITADERMAGTAADLPVEIRVIVGGKDAKVVSRGRAAQDDVVNGDQLKFPRGLAALDQLTFEVPDGVTGCGISVSGRVGNRSSNWATIAVSADGGACPEVAGLSPDELGLLYGGKAQKVGGISLTRLNISQEVPILGSLTLKTDTAGASFNEFTVGTTASAVSSASAMTAGNCLVISGQPSVDPSEGSSGTVRALDAGPSLRIQGPKGSREMKRDESGGYSAALGTGGLPAGLPGLPGLPGGGEEFLEPGEYTVENGGGGADIGSFNAKATVPSVLTWTNQSQIQTVNRSQDLNITWTGGQSGSLVLMIGTSIVSDSVTGSFICMADGAAGRFAVPSAVLSSLPATAGGGGVGVQIGTPTGLLMLMNSTATRVNIPGLDISYFTTGVLNGKSVRFQ